MADLTAICCECLEPMVLADHPFEKPGEHWYFCDVHGHWAESEIGAYVFTLRRDAR